ncbi:MAG TPA: hypothetical protein VG889_17270 [Rhizomicrobium sp.]|nr:hypothetical protein [Rhizomicrobium sp.]
MGANLVAAKKERNEMAMRRVFDLARSFLGAVRRQGVRAIPRIVWKFLLSTRLGNKFAMRGVSGKVVKAAEIPVYRRTYRVELPQGYPARAVEITIGVPAIPPRPHLEFAEHVVDGEGRATDLVLASAMGGFGISHDLGASWKYVKVDGIADRRVVHVKRIGEDEYLLQVTARIPDRSVPREVEVLVANEAGRVLAANTLAASLWHGCRSVDIAGGVLMYAEYPHEAPGATPERRDTSRVWRSHDRGRSWHVAFEARDIRHFHFLQARPGHPGEWWLTSGDAQLESRVWVTKDDGDTWHDVTAAYGTPIRIGAVEYPKTLFRLTDLAWWGDDAIWGTDDFLYAIKGDAQGSRMFRSPCADMLVPSVVGRSKWQIRNLTDAADAGDFLFILTQGCNRADATKDEKMPGVFLMPKAVHDPQLVHLFDVDVHSDIRTGFTYSRASRAAKDGTFFSYRASTDAFPTGHKILRWDVRFS